MKSEKYNEGYQAGLTWDRPWTPGGPFVYRADNWSKQEQKFKAEKSQQENHDWLQGWRDAREHVSKSE